MAPGTPASILRLPVRPRAMCPGSIDSGPGRRAAGSGEVRTACLLPSMEDSTRRSLTGSPDRRRSTPGSSWSGAQSGGGGSRRGGRTLGLRSREPVHRGAAHATGKTQDGHRPCRPELLAPVERRERREVGDPGLLELRGLALFGEVPLVDAVRAGRAAGDRAALDGITVAVVGEEEDRLRALEEDRERDGGEERREDPVEQDPSPRAGSPIRPGVRAVADQGGRPAATSARRRARRESPTGS